MLHHIKLVTIHLANLNSLFTHPHHQIFLKVFFPQGQTIHLETGRRRHHKSQAIKCSALSPVFHINY